MKNLILMSIIICFSFNVTYSQAWIDNLNDAERANFNSIQKSFNEFWKDKEVKRGMGWKQFKRWEYFWEQRLYPSGEFPDAVKAYQSYKNEYDKFSAEELQEVKPEWTIIGPTSVPINRLQYQSSGLGRINIIRIHPIDDNILFAGSSTGGVWKSTDRGQNWNVCNFTDVMSIGVSDIAIAPSNPSTMYVATGDKNGAFQSRAYSVGILKSTNGGDTWDFTSAYTQIASQTIFARILVNKTNPDIIYSGTSSGFYISTDGGTNWTKKADGYFRELEFHPTNPNIIYGVTSPTQSYGSNSQIWVSKDAGNTWVSKKSFSNVSRIELATSPAAPNLVYALCALRNSGTFGGFYVSEDMGETFVLKASSPNLLGIDVNGNDTFGQGFYDLALTVNPLYPEQVYIGGIHIWKSTNYGVNWQLVNHWTGSGRPYVHADQHELIMNDNTLELYSVNDGGIYRSSTNGATWEDISNGISISQFYSINSSNTEKDMIIGGTQDNGTHIFMDGKWQHIMGGDGMNALIDPNDSRIIYASTQYGEIYRSTDKANTFYRISSYSFYSNEIPDWVTPFVLNPKNSQSIYVGYRNIYKSMNRGGAWKKISSFTHSNPLKALAIAPNDSNVIYASSGVILYATYNSGGSWEVLYQAKNTITSIVPDDNDPARVWIATSGYTSGNKIFEIYNGEVKNISYNLPNVPANTIAKLRNSISTMFIGTDVGVYYKDDFTNKWIPFNGNLPNVIISKLEINYSTGKLYAGTYGRGLWQSTVFDCDIPKPAITITGNIEFCIGDSVILENKEVYSEYKWSNGESTPKIIVNKSGTYYLSIKDKNGCIQTSDPIIVTVNSVPNLKVIPANKGVICKGDSLQLSASFGFKNYFWSTGDTTRIIKVTKPGKYSISAITDKNCYGKPDTIEIIESEKPEKPTISKEKNTLTTDSAFAYQWYINGVPSSALIYRTITMNESGKYKVEIFNEANCSAISDEFDFVVSVNDAESNKFYSVFPNPSAGIFTLEMTSDFNFVEFEIKDINGRIINKSDGQSTNKLIKIDLSAFSSGVYFLELKIDGNNYITKLIKN